MPNSPAPRSVRPEASARLRFRLAWLLPTVIALVVASTTIAMALVASREVRRLAIVAAGERLRTPVTELAGNLGSGPRVRLEEIADAAKAAPIRAMLSGDRSARRAARDVLVALQRRSTQRDAIELVTRDGSVVLSVESPNDSIRVPIALRRAPAWHEGDSTGAWISAIQFADSVQWIDLTAAVPGAGEPLGYVVRRRRLLSTGAQSVDLIGNLIGPQARLAIGHPATGWSDLRGGQFGPGEAEFATDSVVTYVASDGLPRIGRASVIPHTPWYVWVEFPVDVVLATTHSFLRELFFGGLLVVLGGASLGALLSRRLSRPLGELTAAAEAVAAGDYERRVTTFGPGEVGTLAAAFNEMAEQVAEGRRTLEDRVAKRTALLARFMERLSESEERFRQLATCAPDAIIIGDGDGHIAYVNPAGERMFGYAPGVLVGLSMWDLVPAEHRGAHKAAHARYVRTGAGRALGQLREMPALRRDGTVFPAELTLTGWPQGGSRAVAAVLRDVTERRRLSDALEQRARELEEANAELAAFSYSVSHDLRAPLRSIHGFTQALLEDHSQALSAEGRDFARRVHAAAQRMSRLIDDLLELSRVSRTQLSSRAVDLVPLATACLEDLRSREPGRRVDFVHLPRLMVSGDERLLRQLMQNLVENAWKFTSTRAVARIELTQGSAGRDAVVTVRDNGVGFDPRYSSQLFGVFQRLHGESEFPGTGVGLAIVQRIVQRHGGTVWAESDLGSGAAFHFTLEPGGRTE